jgi:hypothetical protein
VSIINIDGTEYDIDSLSDDQQKMVSRIKELSDQAEELKFLINGYVNTIKSGLEKSENEE